MKKRILSISLLLILFMTFLSGCGNEKGDIIYIDTKINKVIRKVDNFSDIPFGYEYFDYKQAAIDLDSLLFSFANNRNEVVPDYFSGDTSSWMPIGFWNDTRTDIPESIKTIYYKKRTFGLPTYIGDRRSTEGPFEAIATIPAVLGSSFIGIDKSSQKFLGMPYNFVDMTKAFYSVSTNTILNTMSNTEPGASIWYDLYPQLTFTRLYDLYTNDEDMKKLVISGADAWLNALPYMVDSYGIPFYEFMGFDIRTNTPIYGGWVDPCNGGLSFIFYSAFKITGDEKYLDGCKKVLDYLQDYGKNPNYEAMTDFAPFVAAKLNAQYGTKYDIQKFIEFLFENDSSFRGGWSVNTGNYGNYPVDGLVGDSNYAFSMNTFNLASLIAPMVKYDPRFSDYAGKYLLNVVNNSKWFFTGNMPQNLQSDAKLTFDSEGVICYEGLKNQNGNAFATGDGIGFGAYSNYSVYSASHIGYLGAIVSKTNIDGILQIDLNKTDSYGDNTYPTYLYYNPYNKIKDVEIKLGIKRYDLFDSTTKQIVARDVTGTVDIDIPASGSRVIVCLPANSIFKIKNNTINVNDISIAYYQTAVNILNPSYSGYNISGNFNFEFNYSVPSGDTAQNMKIYYDNILVYDGEPVTTFPYSKSGLDNTNYTFRVVLTTKNGLTDQSSTRVVCN